jgi:hypothetical protein
MFCVIPAFPSSLPLIPHPCLLSFSFFLSAWSTCDDLRTVPALKDITIY